MPTFTFEDVYRAAGLSPEQIKQKVAEREAEDVRSNRIAAGVRSLVDTIIEDAHARHDKRESAESPEEQTEEQAIQARDERASAAVRELVDALGIEDAAGVYISLGGPPPSPEELAAMMGGGEGESPADDEVDTSESCPGCGGGTISRCRCGTGHRRCEKGHDWVGCEEHGPVLAHVPDDGSHPSCGDCALAGPGAFAAKARAIVAEVLEKRGTAEGSKKGWETRRKKGGVGRWLKRVVTGAKRRRRQAKPRAYGPGAGLELKPSQWRAHAEDEVKPEDVEAAMKALAEDVIELAVRNLLDVEKIGTAAGASRGWETRRGRAAVEEAPGEAREPAAPYAKPEGKPKSTEPAGSKARRAWLRLQESKKSPTEALPEEPSEKPAAAPPEEPAAALPEEPAEKPGTAERAVAEAVMDLSPAEQVAQAAEALEGFHQDVFTPTGSVADELASAKPINGRVVATQEEFQDAMESYTGFSAKDDMRASNAKEKMSYYGIDPLKPTRLMADKITSPKKAFRRGYAYRAYGMEDAAKILFHRGALLHAAVKAGRPVKGPARKKKAEKAMESSSALASLVYPAWARPGSHIAARYDERPVA